MIEKNKYDSFYTNLNNLDKLNQQIIAIFMSKMVHITITDPLHKRIYSKEFFEIEITSIFDKKIGLK